MSDAVTHAGDWGQVYLITILDESGQAEDVSAAESIIFAFEDPDGNVTSVSGVIHDGPAGQVKYVVTQSDDIDDEAGKWVLQVTVEYVDGSYSTTVHTYHVYRKLAS